MRISRQTAHKWWRRYQEAGRPAWRTAPAGRGVVRPRPRPRSSAGSSSCAGAISSGRPVWPRRAGMPASTLHRVLQRHGVSRLSDLERKGGRVIRRIETTRPGELVHIDVKKQAKIPKGGGWRVNGMRDRAARTARVAAPLGYAYIHSAIDAYSRLAYSEIHADEQATTAIGFWRRARAFFASYGITVERVLTDNGSCYRAKALRPPSWSPPPSSTPAPSPTAPRPTGRSSATTGPCSTSGPMPGPIAQRRPEPGPSTPGSTCTTIIGTTRPSADHPSVESTTWLGKAPAPPPAPRRPAPSPAGTRRGRTPTR